MTRVPDTRLDAYLSGKHEWQTLTPKEVKSMAIELRRLRSASESIKAVARILDGAQAR